MSEAFSTSMPVSSPSPQPDLQARRDIVCPHCRRVLGWSSPSVLCFQHIFIRYAITLYCTGCGQKMRLGPTGAK
jgi:hypothetical protein